MKKSGLLISLSALVFFSSTLSAQAAEVFTLDLRFMMSHPQVKLLQQVLNKGADTAVAASGDGSKGMETEYFGPLTLSAVIKFQEKYKSEILVPAGLQSGSGFVGVQTRKKLNQIASPILIRTATSTQKFSAPSISQIQSPTIADGMIMSIKGTGFTASNTVQISIEPRYAFQGIVSSDGQNLSFVFQDSVQEAFRAQLAKLPQRQKTLVKDKLIKAQNAKNSIQRDGWYIPAKVIVVNENGQSNSVSIDVNVTSNIDL